MQNQVKPLMLPLDFSLPYFEVVKSSENTYFALVVTQSELLWGFKWGL